MATFTELRTQINIARDNRDKIEADLYAARQKLYFIDQALAMEIRNRPRKKTGQIDPNPSGGGRTGGLGGGITIGGGIGSKELPKGIKLESEKDLLIKQINGLLTQLVTANLALANLESQYSTLGTPQTLVENLNDNTPALLFPIRIEARFMNNKTELWLRFFPDDLHIETHETALTSDENSLGKEYWEAVWKAKFIFSDSMLEAWRQLCTSVGMERAAWVVESMKPTNFSGPGTNFSVGPAFPTPILKAGTWTKAPRVRTMPDRFVARLYKGNTLREVVGNIIPFPLTVGTDPANADIAFEETNNLLSIEPEMKWMTDFNEAVAKGMGMKIPLTASEQTGLDKIVVLGMRLLDDASMGKNRMENLINNWHYSPGGFTLLRHGTPTNNTKDSASEMNKGGNPDEAFDREIKRNLFSPAAVKNPMEKTDGEWLAEALGIEYAPLLHTQNSDQTDIQEAIAMNTALFPATLGYYLEQMTGEWVPNDRMDAFRYFFNNYVSARGFVPSFRVGKQPYGILPASAYSKMVWTQTANNEIVANQIQEVLVKAHQTWSQRLGQVKTAKTAGGNWQQNFLDILGLHPSSVEFYQQFLIGPTLFQTLCKWLNRNPVFNDQQIKAQQTAAFFGKTTKARVTRSGVWGNAQKLNGPIIDVVPSTETTPLGRFYESGNYIQWLGTQNLDTIRGHLIKQGTPAPFPRPLLYLLLRHAYLLESWDTAYKILNDAYTIDRLENELLNIPMPNPCKASRWDVIFFKSKDYDMKQILVGKDLEKNYGEQSKNLLQLRRSFKVLVNMPTARLERCMSEHLDLCAYRMDAWQTGLVNYQLDKQRRHGSPTGHRKGLYIGAYGWLLDLKPAAPRQVVPTNEVPENFKKLTATQPLTYAPDNAGFILAPSVRQAVTGALLRNGYLSRRKKSMEVNLSSQRVRLALEVIEGIQQGHELGALLGYRVERDIKDSYAVNERHLLIYKLRDQFPLTAAKSLDKDTAPPAPVGARNVVHGLNLLKAIQTNPSAIAPAWRATLSAGTQNAISAMLNDQAQKLEQILDAIADLCMAEGVYQAVGGNYDRANAILNALGDGKTIADPEVIKTPRTGVNLTNRFAFLFETILINGTDIRLTTMPWPLQVTFKSLAEPSLNMWLGKIFGNPANIVCRVRWKEGANIGTQWLSIQDLGFQPIDFLYGLGETLNSAAGWLPDLIRHQVALNKGIVDKSNITIDFQDREGMPSPSARNFEELLPLARYLRRMIGKSRALNAQDFTLPNEEANASNTLQQIDYDELLGRARVCFGSFKFALDTMGSFALNPIPSGGYSVVTVGKTLEQLGLFSRIFGIEGLIPSKSPSDSEFQVICSVAHKNLKKREEEAQAAFLEDKPRFKGAQADINIFTLSAMLLDPITPSTPKIPIPTLTKIINTLAGGGFQVLPCFKFKNNNELVQVFDNRSNLLKDAMKYVVDEWFYGAAKVREPLKYCQLAVMLQEALQLDKSVAPTFTPLQLPYVANAKWAGLIGTKPEEMAADTISLVMHLPDNFDPVPNSNRCGLLIDNWVETIPFREETTGIAFHYDGPQTEPPQTLILAITPQITGKWKWNHLMDTLTETLDLAQKRAVDPDLLASAKASTDSLSIGTKFNLVLPGVVAAIEGTPNATIALNFIENNSSPNKTGPR